MNLKKNDMDKIRTGLAAYGMSGRVFHAPFISTNPHFELTAVTERSKELSREKYPDACIVRSFEELIGLEGLDLVVINTPDSTHYEYARRALEAGKHVVVEKPFTTTVAEAEELVALAASRGLTLSVYQNRRWDCDFLTVKQILSKGLLGHLVEFESTFPRYRNFIKPNTWKETGQDGGADRQTMRGALASGTARRGSVPLCRQDRGWPGTGRLSDCAGAGRRQTNRSDLR